jgi:putative DNA primase/helicase
MSDIRIAVKQMIDEGRIPLPVKPGAKATRFPNWSKEQPGIEDFSDGDNLAERLDLLVDVDCDCKETRFAAERLLLLTERKHGRPSVGTTHYFFECPDGGQKSEVFKATDGSVFVEIRTGASQYTLIPPSILPSKDDPNITEQLTGLNGAPGRVNFDGLRQVVALVATAALLAKHWPSGSRHIVARDAAGFLASREIDPRLIEEVIRVSAEMAGDNEVSDRVRVARDSADQFKAGGKTTGLPSLEATLGADVAERLRKWFGGRADAFPLTEAGDAECFAGRYGDRVRFDYRRGRWLLANERGLWTPDPIEQLNQFVVDLMRDRRRQAADVTDKNTRKALFNWTHAGESRKRITNTLALARAVSPVADPGNRWDLDPWLLGVANGVIDLRTGVLRPAQPEDRITSQARIAYDETAICPLWDATIAEIFNRNATLIDYVHRALGYSISGDMREECFFVTWGNGRNGKGTVMNAVTRILGDYADNLSFSALELHDRSGGAASPEIAKLPGKRFVTASESSDVRLNEARIKALTGRDPMTARGLYQAEFTFDPVAKFWLATNKKPRVKDDSDGFWARVKLIPFTRSFAGKEDTTLKDRLRDEEPGILAWLVRGCLAWQSRGLSIDVPADVTNATAEYRRENEPLTAFVDECCVVLDTSRVQASALWGAYQQWAERRHLKPWERYATQMAFGLDVKRRFHADEKRVVTYLGIGLRESKVEEDYELAI